MPQAQRPRVLVFSSGNPAATFLAVGLLHGQPEKFGAMIVRGIGTATPAPEVISVLAEIDADLGAWRSLVQDGPSDEPVEIGLTLCVPT